MNSTSCRQAEQQARPLDGTVVVSVEQAVAAPLASRGLADLGATVIKLERRDGGDFARHYDATVLGSSSAFVWLNRSKQSLAIDLAHPSVDEVLAPLLSRADVFLHNLRPASAERLGLTAGALMRRNPRLIVCEISGYGGADGRLGRRKAYDLLIQAEAGLLSITGTESEPARAGISVADIAAGSHALSGVLGALIQRARSGAGAHLSVSLLDSLAEWMGHPMYYALYGGRQPSRTGTSHAMLAPYGSFATGGGDSVMLAVQNEREWRRLCVEVLARPELVSDPRFATNPARVTHRDELTSAIEASLASMTATEVRRRLDGALIANSRVNSLPEFFEEYRQLAPDRWTSVMTPGGRVDAVIPPGLLEAVPFEMGPVPALGADTDRVLDWLGIPARQIAQLRDEKLIGAEPPAGQDPQPGQPGSPGAEALQAP